MRLMEKIIAKHYTNTEEYPRRPPYPINSLKQIQNMTDDEIVQFMKDRKEWDEAYKIVNTKQKDWREKQDQLDQQFRKDMEELFDMVNHTKRDMVWDKAIEPDAGKEEIYWKYQELVELVK